MTIKAKIKENAPALIAAGSTALVFSVALVLMNKRMNEYKLLLATTGEIIEDMGGDTIDLLSKKLDKYPLR